MAHHHRATGPSGSWPEPEPTRPESEPPPQPTKPPKPEPPRCRRDKVAAATHSLRKALEPYAGARGMVMNETAWLATAHR
jgi:hypothetical protein